MMTACDGTAIKMEDGGDEKVVVKKVAELSAVIPAHTLQESIGNKYRSKQVVQNISSL
jgi:hypothetical protein